MILQACTSTDGKLFRVFLHMSSGLDRTDLTMDSCYQDVISFQHRSQDFIAALECHNGMDSSFASVFIFKLDDTPGNLVYEKKYTW